MDGFSADPQVVWSASKLFDFVSFRGTISSAGVFASSHANASIRRGDTQIGHQHVVLRRMDDPEFEFRMSGLGAACHRYDDSGKTKVTQEYVQNYLRTGILPANAAILCVADAASSFEWSPNGRYLATGSGNPDYALRIFDSTEPDSVITFVRHATWIYYLYWSAKGTYLVSSSHVPDPRMLIWKCEWEESGNDQVLKDISLIHEVTDFLPHPKFHYDKLSARWRGFYGYKRGAISPDEKLLAVSASMRNSSDYLVVYRLPELREIYRRTLRYDDDNRTIPSHVVDAESQITGIDWTRDGSSLFFCQEGALYSLSLSEAESGSDVRLRFISGDECVCNPQYDMIAVGQGYYFDRSDLPGNYEDNVEFIGGRIKILRLPDLEAISEFVAPAGIVGMRWSCDGTRLWCTCRDGTAVEAKLDLTAKTESVFREH